MGEENGNALELLPLLEHLDHIVGCMAISATGEAKSEIPRLIASIEERPVIAERIAAELAELKEAEAALARHDYAAAAGTLVRASHWLWDRVYPVEHGTAPSGTFTVQEQGKPARQMTAREFADYVRRKRIQWSVVKIENPMRDPK